MPNEISKKWYISISNTQNKVLPKKMFEELQRLHLNQRMLKLEIQNTDINVLKDYLELKRLIPSTKKIILNELDRRSGKHNLESKKMSIEDNTGKQIREKDWFEKRGYHRVPDTNLYSDIDMSHSRNKLNELEQEAAIKSMMNM